MKGTIVAQVDSSESFQEFCSTSCLSLYEDKQSPAKGALNKSRCTICGKLTEVCTFHLLSHEIILDVDSFPLLLLVPVTFEVRIYKLFRIFHYVILVFQES